MLSTLQWLWSGHSQGSFMQSLPDGELLLHPTGTDLMRRGIRLKFYSHDDLVDETDKTL